MAEENNLTPEEQEALQAEKEQKSRNRLFGLLIFFCLVLLGVLVYEIVSLVMPNGTTSVSELFVP